MPGQGIEPGTRWWEASALTTHSTPAPQYLVIQYYFVRPNLGLGGGRRS